MSDVAAIEKLVSKQKQLKQEIAKVIVGQDDVVNQIGSLLVIHDLTFNFQNLLF
jgi:hypothetical protein